GHTPIRYGGVSRHGYAPWRGHPPSSKSQDRLSANVWTGARPDRRHLRQSFPSPCSAVRRETEVKLAGPAKLTPPCLGPSCKCATQATPGRLHLNRRPVQNLEKAAVAAPARTSVDTQNRPVVDS